jgi:hypothetical protein
MRTCASALPRWPSEAVIPLGRLGLGDVTGLESPGGADWEDQATVRDDGAVSPGFIARGLPCFEVAHVLPDRRVRGRFAVVKMPREEYSLDPGDGAVGDGLRHSRPGERSEVFPGIDPRRGAGPEQAECTNAVAQGEIRGRI